MTTPLEVIKLMESSKSEDEWNANCDKVKEVNGGYPDFWYSSIVLSGVFEDTVARWEQSRPLIPPPRLHTSMVQKLTLQRLGELVDGLPGDTPIAFHGYDEGCGLHSYVTSDVWLFPKGADTNKTLVVINPGPTYDPRASERADSSEREVIGVFIVCEVICQEPSVSIHPTEVAARKHAVQCAMENLRDPDVPEIEARAEFESTLTEHDRIREGDYEVHILTPSN